MPEIRVVSVGDLSLRSGNRWILHEAVPLTPVCADIAAFAEGGHNKPTDSECTLSSRVAIISLMVDFNPSIIVAGFGSVL
jgi:hypothetical protein